MTPRWSLWDTAEWALGGSLISGLRGVTSDIFCLATAAWAGVEGGRAGHHPAALGVCLGPQQRPWEPGLLVSVRGLSQPLTN